MPSIRLEELSSFGRLALSLDTEFSELTRLAGQVQRLEIDSDAGLEKALKLLNQFSQHAQNISTGIQDFSQVLLEAREKSELAAQQVAERAQLIGQRRQQQDQIRGELLAVEQNVAAANASLESFRSNGKTVYSVKEKSQIKEELVRVNEDLKRFLTDAQNVKENASNANFKNIERDAQNLLDALRSSSRKVDKVLTQL